jgi:hypothetical protein
MSLESERNVPYPLVKECYACHCTARKLLEGTEFLTGEGVIILCFFSDNELGISMVEMLVMLVCVVIQWN